MNRKAGKYIIYGVILLLVVSLTVGFSAFQKQLLIDDSIFNVRLQVDTRVSANAVSSTGGSAVSNYEDYNVSKIYGNVTFPSTSSYVLYKVDLTNYGNVKTGLLNITSNTSGINYQICNASGGSCTSNPKTAVCSGSNCTLGSTKSIYVKVTSASAGTKNVDLDLDFEPYHNISFYNFRENTSSFISEIMEGDTYEVTLTSDPEEVEVTGTGTASYNKTNHKLTITGVTTDVTVSAKYKVTDISNPSNYVRYNNTLFRIVTNETIDDGYGNSELRAKIISNSSIGNNSFDSTSNDFGVSSLANTLNTTYYNSLSEEAKELIETALWTEEYADNVGLIKSSDYTSNSSWLTFEQFTLTPGTSNQIMAVTGSGLSESAITSSKATYPVVYLKENVLIVGGSGTSTDPYILDLPGAGSCKTPNPTTITGRTLTVNGSNQQLVTVTNKLGTPYYAVGTQLNSSNYTSSGSTSIPQRSAVGTYTVYYYIPEIIDNNGCGTKSKAGNVKARINGITYTIAYQKGSNVSSIGKTSDSCTTTGSSLTCNVTLPSITPNAGYGSAKWNYNSNQYNPGASFTLNSSNTGLTMTSSVETNLVALEGDTITKSYSTTSQTVTNAIKAATNGSGTYTYSITSGNTNNYFSLNGRNLTIAANTPVNENGYTITIKVTDSNTLATATADYVIIINKATGSISLSPTSGTLTYGTNGSSTITKVGDGTVGCSTSNNTIATCSVSGNTLTITPVANTADNKVATITVTLNPGTNYSGASATYTATVNRKTLTCPSAPADKTYNGSNQASGITCPTGSTTSGNTNEKNASDSYAQTCTASAGYKFSSTCRVPWKIKPYTLTSTQITDYTTTWRNDSTSYIRTNVSTGIASETVNIEYTPYSNTVGEYTYSTTAGSGKYTAAIVGSSSVVANYSMSSAGKFTLTNATLSGGSVAISGTNTWGQTLTATITDTTPAANYTCVWYSTNENNTASGTSLGTATISNKKCTYTIPKEQVGKYIYVIITAALNNYTTKYLTDLTDATANTTATVAKQNLSVTKTDYSAAYDGSAHGVTVKVTSANWDGATIVSGTSTSYGQSVTTSGIVNSTYTLKPTYTDVTSAKTVYYKITGGTYYKDATGSGTVTITQKKPTITVSATTKELTYPTPGTLTYTYDGDGTLSCASSNTSYVTCSVSGGTLTLTPIQATSSPITVTLSATSGTNYSAPDNKTVSVTVLPKTLTATFYYNSNTTKGSLTVATKTATCSISSGTSCTVSVPSEVSSSVGIFNATYIGVSRSTSNITAGSLILTANQTFYAFYRANVSVKYPIANGSTTSTAYRHEYFTSTTNMDADFSLSPTNLNVWTFDDMFGTPSDYVCDSKPPGNFSYCKRIGASTITIYTNASVSVTFYYNSNTTVGELTKSTIEKSQTIAISPDTWDGYYDLTIPTVVTSSVGKYNSAYKGISSSGTGITDVTKVTNGGTYYAYYSSPITLYYPNTANTVSNTSTALYRNEYFNNASGSSMYAVTATSQTSTTQAATVSLSILKGTLAGLIENINSASYWNFDNSNHIVNQGITTFYVVTKFNENVTFKYNSNNTCGGVTLSTATQEVESRYYCATTATIGTTHGTTTTVPTAVTNSKGQYNSSYRGVAGVNSLTLTTSFDGGSTYYAVYSSAVTNYYYNTSYINRTIYRNEYLASASATSYTAILATSNSSKTNYSTATGPNNAVWYGLADTNTTTRKYDSVASAATSNTCTTSLYTIYQFNVTYEKGSNVASIGDTSGNCLLKHSDTSCSVTLPSITPNTGYISVGWNTTSGATTGTAAGSSYSITTNNTIPKLYANAILANYQNTSTNAIYSTLNEAFAAVENNQTIKVLQNVTETTAATLASTKTGIKLDLNGKTIALNTLDNTSIKNNGELDIYNTSSTTGIIEGSSSNIISNSGTLTTNGTSSTNNIIIRSNYTTAVSSVISNSSSSSIILNAKTTITFANASQTTQARNAISNSGSLRINGATITNNASETGHTDRGILLSSANATLTMTSGTINSIGSAIYNNSSTGTITLGTNDSNVSTDSPTIQTIGTSSSYCLYNASGGTFNFYDGIIKSSSGTGYSISGAVSNTPDNYSIYKSTTSGVESAILIATPATPTISGAGTSVYGNARTLTCATSTTYPSSVNKYYSFGYSETDGGEPGNWTTASTTATYSAPSTYTVRYYSCKVYAGSSTSQTTTVASSTESDAAVTYVNARINFDATTNGGTISGSATVYMPYNASSGYTTRTGTTARSIPSATKEGNTFNGWYTAASGGTQVITSTGAINASVSGWTNTNGKFILTSTSNTTSVNKLYAQFTAKTYTVTYYLGNASDTAGSTQLGSAQTCTFGTDCTLTSFSALGGIFPYGSGDTNHTNRYWEFWGWGTSNSTTERTYANSATINPTTYSSNINLYAIGRHPLRFYGGIKPTSGTYNVLYQYWNPHSTADSYRTTITIPEPTAISGWTFVGYLVGSNATSGTTTYAASTVGTTVRPAINNSGYYRSVYKRTLTVNYNANGGSGTTTATTLTQYYNSGYNNADAISTNSITLASNNFTRAGFGFSKWADGSASGTQYSAGAAYTGLAATVSETNISTTMYAIWTGNTYTATFYYNSNNTCGSLTVATATASCTVSSGTTCTVTVPSAVSSSKGQYNSAYKGVRTGTSSMAASSSLEIGANTAYYANYSSALTIFRPTSATAASSTTAYRNEYFTSTTAMGSVVSTANSNTTAMTAVSGLWSSLTYYGFAINSNTSTRDFSSISSIATDSACRTSYYTIGDYTENVTFKYNNNTTCGSTTVTTTTSSVTGKGYCTSDTVATAIHGTTTTVPSAVSSSKGQYNSDYRAIAAVNSLTAVTTFTGGNTYYAVYSSAINLYRPTSASAASSTTVYRNEYLASASATTYTARIATANNSTTNITAVSGLWSSLTFYGYASSANTSARAFTTVAASIATDAACGTTYYTIGNYAEDVTFKYNNNTTCGSVTVATTTSSVTGKGYCTSNSAATTTHGSTTTVPSAVSSSKGQYNSNYRAMAAVNSLAAVTTFTGGNTYYAVYSSAINLYRPTSATAASATVVYRNEYLASATATSYTARIATANNSSTNITAVNGLWGDLSFYGYAASANTATRAFTTVAASIATDSACGTTYYTIGNHPEDVTFKYNNNTTCGSVNLTTSVISVTGKGYCSSTSAATTSPGSTTTVPSAVSSSMGQYNSSYRGVGVVNSLTPSTTFTGGNTYYAIYSSAVTNYYYNSSYTSRTIYRNEYIGSASSTAYTARLSTNNNSNTNYTTAAGPNSSTWYGLADTNTTTRKYSSVSAAATSNTCTTTLYSIYQYTINYAIGANVSSIGATSGSCRLNHGSTSCDVTLPTITANSGNVVLGWSPTNGATTGTAAGASYTIGTNTTIPTLYANAGAGYTLSFNANGGSVSPTTKGVMSGTNYSDLPTPTNSGKTFAGWYSKFTGSNYVNMGRQYMYQDKISIHFTAFSQSWSNGTIALISCTENGGWEVYYDTSKFYVYMYDAGVGYKIITSTVNSTSVSAGWHDFDVVFNGTYATFYIDGTAYGTSANFSSGKIGYHASNSLLLGAEAGPAASPAGSYFTGFIGNVIIEHSDQRINSSSYNTISAPSQNLTLYARWKPASVTVTFHRNQSASDTTTRTQTFTTGVSGNKFGYDTSGNALWGTTGDFGGWTNSGYRMLGWGTSQNSTTGTYSIYSDVVNWWIEQQTPTIHLYAVWIANSTSGSGIAFHYGGGTDQGSGIYYSMTMYITYNLSRDSSGNITGTVTIYSRMKNGSTAYSGSWPGYIYGTVYVGNKSQSFSGLNDCNGTLATFSGTFGTGTSISYRWVNSGNISYNVYGSDSSVHYITFGYANNAVGGSVMSAGGSTENISQSAMSVGESLLRKFDEIANGD